MRHLARSWAGAFAAACLPFAAAAQEAAPAAPAARPAPVPKYNWIQADFVSSYIGAGDGRVASQAGYRLSTHLLLAKPFYFTASFGNQYYDFAGTAETFEVDDTEWFAGAGAFMPLTPSTHVTAAVTYEVGDQDSESNLAGGNSSVETDGLGLQLGLRSQLTPSAEAALSYKYRDQSGDAADSTGSVDFDRTGHTFGASLVGKLTPMLALVLKIERTSYSDEFDGGGEFDSDLEAYTLGLRFRL